MKYQNYPSDEKLHQSALTGDAYAEETLIKKYSRVVEACARPYFLSGADSDDLFQEGMLGLLNAVREFDPHGGASFRTFAELCIRRRLFSAIKIAVGRKHMPLNESLPLESSYFDDDHAHAAYLLRDAFQRDPEDLFIDEEASRSFFASFLCCLSKLEAEILDLFLQDLSYQEIAALSSRTVKSVDNAVQRIRRKLARFLSSGDISLR